MIYYDRLSSLIGEILLTSDGLTLTGLFIPTGGRSPKITIGYEQAPELAIFSAARKQLGEYFAGISQGFDLPLQMNGTNFQKAVWRELLSIPYGATISYSEQAKRLGNPNAQRAVGLANGCNPISIIVPCHRVIGANGSLTGYGGGIAQKRALLELEQRYANRFAASAAVIPARV